MIYPSDPLETVSQALERQPGVTDWLARQTTQRSAQLFLIGAQTESRRLVDTEQVQIQVYNDHPRQTQPSAATAEAKGVPQEVLAAQQASSSNVHRRTARGATSRVLLSEEIGDQSRLQHALEEAVFIAGLTDNPLYSLPTPPRAGFPVVETVDRALAASDEARLAALEALRERLLAAVATEPGIRLSSAELFATASEIALRNSQGIRASHSETEIFCDLVLLASDGAQTAEYQAMPQRRRLADLDIEETVRQAARFARDSLHVVLTPTHEGPVVISGEALIDLFSPLIFHSSARAAYQSLSRFSVGASICGVDQIQGDRLTFISNALLPYGLASTPFSDDGLPGERVVLVQDHQVSAFWAEQRYADYLNMRPTGSFANIEILPGTHAIQDMLGESPAGVSSGRLFLVEPR